MQFVIIGNSAAALSALSRFRSLDKDSRVTLISAEPGSAYSRVLLPYFLRRKIPYENLFIRRQEDYDRLGVTTELGVRVSRVDPESHTVTLEDGRTIAFDRLLIASGSRPFLPPIQGLAGENVFHLWTLNDTEQLDSLFEPGRRALVLGSGFIALQAAWAAQQRGLRVTVYELLPRIMPTVLDERAASLLQRKIEEHGVSVRVGIHSQSVDRSQQGVLRVHAENQPPLEVEMIIVGAGVRPNIEFLEGSTVRTDRGIPVDRNMQTNVPGIYAAGDVARGATIFGETHQTHALWPTAVEHGTIAGANLGGRQIPYQGSLNMNVTEMFGVTVASMGKFSEEEGFAAHIEQDGSSRYLKIVLREGIPVGAAVLGEAEDAAVLGKLRPWIRNRRKLPSVEGFLQGKYLLPRKVA
ncbi:MAG: NAD(P)/FAD-dependent oxidoreductase [Spirochaetaceae bacterium]|nr:MAG: NAD(P)/FAD-dependent oxidoreductase [Spirochaetaceae bacterium]